MILSFDEAGALLDEMAEEFPPEFYDELNGGIALLPEAKEDSEGEPGELYIMGEYCNDMMGKYINLYYGSFAALAEQEDWTEEDWEDELYTTLAHEFTHHIEGRAGERGLERKDEQFIDRALPVPERTYTISLLPSWVCRPMEHPGSSRPRMMRLHPSANILAWVTPSPPLNPGMAVSSMAPNSTFIPTPPLTTAAIRRTGPPYPAGPPPARPGRSPPPPVGRRLGR